MPEHLVPPSNISSALNDENHICSKIDTMKQSTTPLRNRKPLQSLTNTPSHVSYSRTDLAGSNEKGFCVDSLEVDLKRGTPNSSIKTSAAHLEDHNNNSNSHTLLYERISFCHPPSMILNNSIEAPSSEESFDQSLVNDNTVFRALLIPPELNPTENLDEGGISFRPEESFEEDDMLLLRLANPICEESYESSSSDTF